MLKEVAVTGMTVVVDQTTVDPPGTVTATIVVNPPTGTKCKAENKLIYREGDTITVTLISHSLASIPFPGPVTGTWEATAEKTKAEGKLVLRVDDLTDEIEATPQQPSTPDPIDYPISFKCKVTVANQTKVKAE
ncbi:MAG: hypothetical protein JRD89_09245 [Deltaproteobacteria bacterium]|nr:hypothetical protein [Deltaproteobacteria bacterium]